MSGSGDWFERVFDVPVIRFLGATPVDPENPEAGLSLTVSDAALNAADVVHGGALATLLDLAAYLAVLPTLGPGEQAVTNTFCSNYLAAARAGEQVVATGQLLRRTRNLAFTSASLVSGTLLVATASVTKSIVRSG